MASWAVTQAKTAAMAVWSSFPVRACALRKNCFTLLHIFSTGFKSGE